MELIHTCYRITDPERFDGVLRGARPREATRAADPRGGDELFLRRARQAGRSSS